MPDSSQVPEPSFEGPSFEGDPSNLPNEQRDETRRLSLEDVLEAGAETLTTSIGAADRGGLNYDVLDHAVTRTGTQLAGRQLDDPKISNQNLVDEEREGGDGIGATELEQLVAILETEADVPNFGDELASKMEHVSILLHEVHRIGIQDPDAFGRRCEAATRGLPGARITELLVVAVEDLAHGLDDTAFDVWMRAMGPLLRRAVPFLGDRLAEFVLRATNDAARERLWPHVIDAFMLSLKTRSREIDPNVHALQPDAIERGLVRLRDMQAFGSGLLAPGTYQIDQEFARPIALMLMRGATQQTFGSHLLAAFREAMPHDFGARSCVLAYRRYDDALGWVLTKQLEAPRSPLDAETERSTAWVLVHGLLALDRERHDETWIPDAILWLGQRDMSRDPDEQRLPLKEFLLRVKSERSGIKRTWSKACRKAAAEALENRALADGVEPC